MTRTLGGRAILVTCATAVVSVIAPALAALPVAVTAADTQARRDLDEKTILMTEALADDRPAQRQALVNRLRQQNIQVYLIRRGSADQPGLPRRVVNRITAGSNVEDRAVVGGYAVLVAGRPLNANGAGVVLTRRAATGTAARVLDTLWLALAAGLLAGIIAGGALARLGGRPIRDAASAAGRLSSGDHSVRLAVRPPEEVAELARAFNRLAAALATSEGRQRDFLLSVSHELRTPLTTIRGYAEALADGVVGTDEAPDAGRTMLDEAERLDRLISDLLVLARLEAADLPIELMPVALVELMTSAAAAWQARVAAAGVTLHTEIPPGPVAVATDPGRIRQVIDGLCENALRIVPPGAPLVLAVRALPGTGGTDVPGGGIVEIRAVPDSPTTTSRWRSGGGR